MVRSPEIPPLVATPPRYIENYHARPAFPASLALAGSLASSSLLLALAGLERESPGFRFEVAARLCFGCLGLACRLPLLALSQAEPPAQPFDVAKGARLKKAIFLNRNVANMCEK